MRRDFLFGIGLLASVAAGAGSAIAADIVARPAAPPPPAVAPAFVPDWVGFYVGGHGGGGGASTSFEPAFFDSRFTSLVPTSPSASGGLGGFQFGHNWQWGPVVGGLEIDYSGADIKETTNILLRGRGRPEPSVHTRRQDRRVGFRPWAAWLSDISQLAPLRHRRHWLGPSALAYG